MRRLYFLILLGISFSSFSQPATIYADPAVGSPQVYDMAADTALNTNRFVQGNTIKLKIPVRNFDLTNGFPTGTCELRIGLGLGLVVDPAFNLSSAAPGNFFNWRTVKGSSGQVQIIGTLVNTLPANYSEMAVFNLKPIATGSSSVSTNFGVSNDNIKFNFSDNNPGNNTSSLAYTITPTTALPVTFTQVMARKMACNFSVNWSVENQLNISHYDVEAGIDGNTFIKAGEVAAQNIKEYGLSFPPAPSLTASVVFIRVKSVDLDGKYQYSKVVTVSGICQPSSPWQLYLYPNPATYVNKVTIATKQGEFNGNYKLILMDYGGRVHQVTELQLHNLQSFIFKLDALPSHQKYIISIANTNGSESGSIEFER